MFNKVMLINCPKCGFSQPKDKYCASCGIDMDTFRPAKPSLIKQLWVSPVFLIGLTLGVVMLSVVFIRQKQREEIAGRAELLRAGPVMVDTSATTPEPTAAAPEIKDEFTGEQVPKDIDAGAMAAASTDASAPATMSAISKTLASEESATAAEDSSASKAAAPTRKINMTATYAEVSKQMLAQIEEDSQATGQFTDFGEFKAGALPDIQGHMRGINVLQKVSKTFEGKGNQQRWMVGAKSAEDDDIGLVTLVSVEQGADGKYKGEVEVLRSLPEGVAPNVALVKKSYPISSFELGSKTGWMIVLADLPQPAADSMLRLGITGDSGFLRLFRRDTYIKDETEFTLFLEFDSPNP